tara:strand:+ start:3511 stop:4800 length:1290 start_codon:yes stop_codon:yes gene_type:complete
MTNSSTPFLLNGKKTSDDIFSTKPHILDGDREAVLRVMDNECLSDFFGSTGDKFLGGQEVKNFESKWSTILGYKYAISTNSWSTGLISCLKACGIGYGDEVICPPLTMSATTSSILEIGAIPIFCDIEDKNYNINPELIEDCITDKTKAIMVVHLFGHPANMAEIARIAKKHSIHVIEDAAHAPMAKIDNSYVGGITSIGGFSMNYHKHIHCGEGGVIVTNNELLAKRAQLIRNHGENAIKNCHLLSDEFLIGSNYRLTEIQAAIGSNQINFLDSCISHRNNLHSVIEEELEEVKHILETPNIEENCTHSFYCYALKFKEVPGKLGRKKFVDMVNGEFGTGSNWDQIPLSEGYTKPLYTNKIYQEPNIDKSPYPVLKEYKNYYKHLKCKVAENAHSKNLILSPIIHEGNNRDQVRLLCKAIKKIISYYV